MNVAQKVKLRWLAWSAVAFVTAWFFFGLFVSVCVVFCIWVAGRLFRAWKTKKEFEGAGTDLPKRIAKRLTEMIDHPSNRYKNYVDCLKEHPENHRKYRQILLDQVESACRLAYSVHLSSPERPLMRDCQLSATLLAGVKLARALDISAAMELKQPLDWEKDKEYLLQVVKKNEGEDGTSTGVLAASSYESASGPVIGYQLYLQAEHDWFEAEMWAYVAHYAGDDNALEWFEEAMPRVAKLSVEYWQRYIAETSKSSTLTRAADQPVGEPVEEPSMRCMKCGTQHPSDYSFCTVCGASLKPIDSPVLVAGTHNNSGAAALSPKNELIPSETRRSLDSLKNVTPHLLAIAMLGYVRDHGHMWRSPEIEIPWGADGAVATACEFYEIRIFLDLLKLRFGAGISQLVEASVASIVDNVGSHAIFSLINGAILHARLLGTTDNGLYGQKNPAPSLELQIAGKIQELFKESNERKQLLRLPLAQSLSHARISVELLFPSIVAKLTFEPASISLVTLETEYRGSTIRWSDTPGCFERHLQRKDGNVLFPESERKPTDAAIREARSKDNLDLAAVEKDVTSTLKTTQRFLGQETVTGEVLLNFLKKELDPTMRRVNEIGAPARRFFKVLEELRNSVFQDLEGKLELEPIRKGLPGQFNMFLAQVWRIDTPIAGEEIIPTLLCESTDTVAAVGEFFQRDNPELIQSLHDGSVTFLKDATGEGFELPGAKEKLAVLKVCTAGARTND
jgi:hypothetical protein